MGIDSHACASVDVVVDRLDTVRLALREALGHPGRAAVEVREGHDRQLFVYLQGLTDEQGVPLPGTPQQLLGIAVWLDVVERLNDLVHDKRQPEFGTLGDVAELRF